MIERNFIKQGIRNTEIEAYLRAELDHAEYSHSEIKRTPLNTRIMVYAGRPGMVIGRAGTNIQRITETLEKKFNINKPQLEIVEIQNQDLDARVVAKKIAAALEKGNNPRKVANIFIKKILSAGAIGAEIVIAGKSGGGGRSKTDKFIEGYLKKCGDTAEKYADRAKLIAKTKPGAVGIKVRIMKELPEEIRIKEIEVRKEKPAETLSEAVKEMAAEATEAAAEAEERKEIAEGVIEPPVKPVPEDAEKIISTGSKSFSELVRKAESASDRTSASLKKEEKEKKPRAKKEKAEKEEKK